MKHLTALLILIFNLSLFSAFAQKEDENLKEIFLDAEFFFLNEDYDEALSNYIKLYKRGYEANGNINFRLGQCYLHVPGEKDKAIAYLEKAVQNLDSRHQEGVFKENHAPYDAYFYLGNAYRINHQFAKAISSYETFKSFYEGEDAERVKLANQEIEACKFAAVQILKPGELYTLDLGRPISTSSRDVFPVVSGDLNSLVYVSKQKFYDALFFSQKVNGKWSTPVNITPDVQSDGDQYPTFLSYDGTELYLRKEDNFEAELLVSKKVDGVWTKSRSIGKNINSKYWEGNLSITKDGKTMYFSSNRNEGSGALDIYRSKRGANDEWGTPVNLGPVINTSFNDDAPYITEDGTRLYFISQGHKTMGGYDILYCNVAADGSLSSPVHMGYPVNSTDDDIYFYPVKNGQIAYTAANIPGNLGFEDIYEIYINPDAQLLASLKVQPKEVQVKELSPEDKVIVSALPEKPVEEKPVAEKPVEEKPVVAETPKPVEEKPVAQNPVEVKPLNEPTQTKQPVVAAPEKEITPATETKVQPAVGEAEAPIILPVLFFNFNSSEITENSRKSLDYIATVFKNYSGVKIELVGHTDALGSDNFNQTLSVKRAQMAKNYLVKKGVGAGSISINGKGEAEFVAINANSDGSDNAEGRKFNRRVEIRILENKPDRKIVIQELNIPNQLKVGQP